MQTCFGRLCTNNSNCPGCCRYIQPETLIQKLVDTIRMPASKMLVEGFGLCIVKINEPIETFMYNRTHAEVEYRPLTEADKNTIVAARSKYNRAATYQPAYTGFRYVRSEPVWARDLRAAKVYSGAGMEYNLRPKKYDMLPGHLAGPEFRLPMDANMSFARTAKPGDALDTRDTLYSSSVLDSDEFENICMDYDDTDTSQGMDIYENAMRDLCDDMQDPTQYSTQYSTQYNAQDDPSAMYDSDYEVYKYPSHSGLQACGEYADEYDDAELNKISQQSALAGVDGRPLHSRLEPYHNTENAADYSTKYSTEYDVEYCTKYDVGSRERGTFTYGNPQDVIISDYSRHNISHSTSSPSQLKYLAASYTWSDIASQHGDVYVPVEEFDATDGLGAPNAPNYIYCKLHATDKCLYTIIRAANTADMLVSKIDNIYI